MTKDFGKVLRPSPTDNSVLVHCASAGLNTLLLLVGGQAMYLIFCVRSFVGKKGFSITFLIATALCNWGRQQTNSYAEEPSSGQMSVLANGNMQK